MTKRIFTSIDLPESVKQYLTTLQNRGVYWIKWLPPKNFHITLNFLGDLDEGEIEVVKQVTAEVAAATPGFQLILKHCRGERDMLWVTAEKSEAIDRLHWQLKTEFKKAGVGKTERRGYVPHVLLAKSKTGRHMSWLPAKFEPQEFMVDRINLYESELTPGAATHKLIQSFALENPNSKVQISNED